ncbi:hypothetical protein ANN_00938 [Periplaneta americana]|uniref:Per a allergen n=1 Tax=Periplaneta americana TaxID=6978 RepID=A0ABQ8TV30_PERAM|nr:hypothetical protein ANN_00938 [Periplaneta americana]
MKPVKGLDRPAGRWPHAHMPKQRWTIIQPEWRYHIREGDGNVIKMITGRDEEEMAGVDLHIETNCHFAVQEESRRLCRLLFDDKAGYSGEMSNESNHLVLGNLEFTEMGHCRKPPRGCGIGNDRENEGLIHAVEPRLEVI